MIASALVAKATGGTPPPVAASLIGPTPGSTFSGETQLFYWNAAPGATLYQLFLGNSVGSYDLGYYPPAGTTSTAINVSGIPVDGRTLYARLYSSIGGAYYYRDYTFTAATSSPPTPASFITPVNGSTISGASQFFNWTNVGAALYQVWVGSTVGTYDYGYYPAAGTADTSTTITGLPTDGRTVYVRLHSNLGGIYYYRDYTFVSGP